MRIDLIFVLLFALSSGVNSYVFYLVSEKMSWIDAQTYCRRHHTDLATVNSQMDINKLLKSLPSGFTDLMWIGLYRTGATAPWVWSDGSISLFRSWESLQPNNDGGNQYCVLMTATGGWNDGECPDKFSFICYGDLLAAENAALWGKTSESSNYGNWLPTHAIDGVLTTWAHTNNETDPWWRVDLLKVYRVNRVTITNRNDFASRLDGAVIRIGNFLDVYSNSICGVISTLAASATATFSCGGMEGRYMVVHIPGNDKFLTLPEVGVYGYLAGNRAVGGAVIQSSTSGDWFAEKAIDSNRGFQQLYTGCSSTLNQTNPWWRLDLLEVYRVSEVVITNRNDCCAEQINGAEIHIGNSLENNGSNNPICAVIPAIPAGESYSYSCDAMEGRYVIVHIPGDMKTLTLCEVEVYGYLAENLAVAGAATQSSTSGDWFAEKAIDRGLQQLYTGCSSTLNQTNPWWRLDLHHIYRVYRVVISNRKDCCAEQINRAEIHIGNSLENNGNNNPICAVIAAIPAGESYSYSCGAMEGRYVNLIIPGNMKTLTLCEVKVYGEGPVLKRSFVKILFKSGKDLTDSTMRENVLKQLGSALAARGLTNVTLRWSQSPKQVIQKLNAKSRCSKEN